VSRLEWGASGARYFETGLDRGVLYVSGVAVPWHGLISVEEDPSIGSARGYYFDGKKYANVVDLGEFEGTLTAYSSPPEFDQCDGMADLHFGIVLTHQRREPFSLAYRSRVGNDIDGVDHGYKIHLIYNAMAVPSARSYNSLNSNTEPISFSWEISTSAVDIPTFAPTAHVIIDSRTIYPAALAVLEDILYGSDENEPRLPYPTELWEIIENASGLRVIDHGDGTWTATTELDGVIEVFEDDSFEIEWDTVEYLDENTYTITTF